MLIKKGYKVLFHGDSITDAGRDRGDYHSLTPNGYTEMAAKRFNAENPELCAEFFNRAISGFRTCDVLGVIDDDLETIKPDLVCIHIGVNDTWRRFDQNSFTSPEEFEENLRTIIKKIKDSGAKLVILGAYLFPAEDKLHWREDLDEKLKITSKLAKRHADAYVNVDKVFAELLELGAPWQRFSTDGVHPNERGAEILADCFLKAINEKSFFEKLID